MRALMGLHDMLAEAARNNLVIEKITVDSNTFYRMAAEVAQLTVYGGEQTMASYVEFQVANFEGDYVTIRRGQR